MHLTIDYLSIWEIAHRWHGHDPNLTDPQALPLPVQDTLRTLTYGVMLDEFHVANERGVQHWNYRDIPSRWEYVPGKLLQVTEEPLEHDEETEVTEGQIQLERMTPEEAGVDPDEIDREYADFVANRLRRHSEATDGLEECYSGRQYDKRKLESIYLVKHELYEYCRAQGIEPPPFWFSAQDIAELQRPEKPSVTDEDTFRRRHGESQKDKDLCRAIASTLWLIHPELNIQEVINHEALLRYGNGKLYKGRNTLRDWVKDLDPRPKEQKRGRPKKRE